MGGISTIGYTYQDHFSVEKEVVEADNYYYFQVKGGGRYNLTIDFQHLLIVGMFKNHQFLIM